MNKNEFIKMKIGDQVEICGNSKFKGQDAIISSMPSTSIWDMGYVSVFNSEIKLTRIHYKNLKSIEQVVVEKKMLQIYRFDIHDEFDDEFDNTCHSVISTNEEDARKALSTIIPKYYYDEKNLTIILQDIRPIIDGTCI